MKLISNIDTPVYLKTDKDMEWPKDKMFYILSANGLFLCRNHEWFQSCAPAKKGPGELEAQEPFCAVSYPKIPQALIEKAVGFFRRIEKDHGWEAALILVWNRLTGQMELVCPDQKGSGASVEYDIPKLPQHMALIGDMHSHPTFSPTPSYTDKDDEAKRPGLHIIVGYVNHESPEFHCEVVVDGERFTVNDHALVMDSFESCDTDAVPKEWLAKCKPLYGKFSYGGYGGGYEGGYEGGTGYQYQTNRGPDQHDKEIIAKLLRAFAQRELCPTPYEVRQALFTNTKITGYQWCEAKADKFVRNWDKKHEEATAESGA